ncbi:RNA polymerase sigma factor [Ferdinandcohnia sp. Marseille-Q9671]
MNVNRDAAMEIKEGHEKYTIEDLFRTYKDPIYHFIYRYCQDEQLSIDTVQDTFVRYHKYQDRYDSDKSSMKTYLFRMAYQIMINRLNRQRTLKRILPFLYQPHPQQELLLDDKLTIQAALQQLPDQHRAVLLLTYYHDLTQKEISTILEIPVGTVKSRLHASLKKMKNLLEGIE